MKIRSDTLRLTLFGPGFGEAVTVEIGGRYLFQVDCCRPAIAHLQELRDQDFHHAFFLLTHPHFDHFQAVEDCLAFPFLEVCRFAGMHATELDSILQKRGHKSTNAKFRGSAHSFRRFLAIWKDKDPSCLQQVSRNTMVAREEFDYEGTTIPFEVMAISPTEREVSRFNAALGSTATANNDHNNDASVILRIRFGDADILLTGDAGDAVFTEAVEAAAGRANILKLAHHGSARSNSASLTTRLLKSDRKSLVIVTPFHARGLPDVSVISDVVEQALGGDASRLVMSSTPTRDAQVEAEWRVLFPEADLVTMAISKDGCCSVGIDSHGTIKSNDDV